MFLRKGFKGGERMQIIVISEWGTLIDENEYETNNAAEALRLYLDEEQPILTTGDVIQIRE